MWFSNTGEYVIKTVDRGQGNSFIVELLIFIFSLINLINNYIKAKFLFKWLRGYYMNIEQNPNTLLTKYYGLYALKEIT